MEFHTVRTYILGNVTMKSRHSSPKDIDFTDESGKNERRDNRIIDADERRNIDSLSP